MTTDMEAVEDAIYAAFILNENAEHVNIVESIETLRHTVGGLIREVNSLTDAINNLSNKMNDLSIDLESLQPEDLEQLD